jgi:Acetyltransferase (GNAT) family.
MSGSYLDPQMVRAWLAARSLSRGLPAPVDDRGGFRVDTASAEEQVRWVFVHPCDGLREIAERTVAPRHFIKLCGTPDELMAQLPARWKLQPVSYFMINAGAADAPSLADGYRLELQRTGNVTCAAIRSEDGQLAACGYGAETDTVFIYDRIRTEESHRRRGLGRAIMAALGQVKRDRAKAEVLTATEEGRALYLSLGWRVLSFYVTAGVVEVCGD